MAVSPRSTIAALLLAAAMPAAVAQDRSQLPVTVEARSSDFDYRNGVLVFDQVTIVQGDVRIQARRAQASGLNFQDSHWEFTGDVRITIPDGAMGSESARVRFARGEISSAAVTGSPATFEQRRDDEFAQGRAAQIDYDLGRGTVRLAGEAWLSDGRNEITGTSLVYSLKSQRVIAQAGDQGGEPVRITINPQRPTPPPEGSE